MVFQIIRRFPRCLGRRGYEETKRIESGEGSSKKKKRQKMLEQIKGAKEISFLIKTSGSPVRVTEAVPRAGVKSLLLPCFGIKPAFCHNQHFSIQRSAQRFLSYYGRPSTV
jgi:hypothetical protein